MCAEQSKVGAGGVRVLGELSTISIFPDVVTHLIMVTFSDFVLLKFSVIMKSAHDTFTIKRADSYSQTPTLS